jgi:maleate cis-trans isomerase
LPEWTYRLAKKADKKSAEAVCIFATDLRSIEILTSLEEVLGKPVVSSNQAILFNTLRLLNYDQTIPGYGSLLERVKVRAASQTQ